MATLGKFKRYSTTELLDLGQTCHSIFDRRKLHHSACIEFSADRRGIKSDPMAFTLASRDMLASSDSTTHRHTFDREESSEEGDKDLFEHNERTTWQLRPREHSKSSSDQPISAPTEISAQRTENFKRFYKAVVSPSHVRVTARGRIVPNYRQRPPVFEWDAEQKNLETFGLASSAAFGPLSKRSEKFITPLGYPVGHFFGQVINDSYETSAPLEHLNPNIAPQSNLNRSGALRESNLGDQTNFPISHPSQFDPTKPYLYNGRLVYPIQTNYDRSLPISLHPSFGLMENMANLEAPYSLQDPANKSGLSSGIHTTAPAQMSSIHDDLSVHQDAPASVPQQSSPSLLQKHITTLQHQALFIKNALDNNEDQIDVDVARKQLQHVQSQIQALEYGMSTQPLESIFKTQTSATLAGGLPATGSSAASRTATLGSPHVDLKTFPTVDKKSEPATRSPAKGPAQTPPALTHTLRRTHAIPIMSAAGASLSEGNNGSRLPPTAAKAPPFKPRLQVSEQPPGRGENISTSTSSSNDYILPNTGPEFKLASSAPINWPEWKPAAVTNSTYGQYSHFAQSAVEMPSGSAMAPSFPVHLQDTQKAHSAQVHSNLLNQPKLFGQVLAQSFGDTFDDSNMPTLNGMAADQGPSATVPYLMGFPPPGVSFSKVVSQQLVYSRPLNEAEIKARELYWGAAPRESTQGLPKFDGRDFFAPSPVKPKLALAQTGFGPLPDSWDLNADEKAFIAEMGYDLSQNTGRSFDAPRHSAQQHRSSSRNSISHAAQIAQGAFLQPGQFAQSYGSHNRSFSQTSVQTRISAYPHQSLPTDPTLRTGYNDNDSSAENDKPFFTGWGKPRHDSLADAQLRSRQASQVSSRTNEETFGPHVLVREKAQSPRGGRRRRSRSRSNNKVASGPPQSFFQGMKRANLPLTRGSPASNLITETAAAYLPYDWISGSGPPSQTAMPNDIFGTQSITRGIAYQTAVGGSSGSLHDENQPPINGEETTMGALNATELLRRLNLQEGSDVLSTASSQKLPDNGKGPVYDGNW